MLSASLIVLSGPTWAQDWVKEELGNDDGVIYRQSASDDAPIIRVIRESEIEASCSCDLQAESRGDEAEAILFGLSTLWIDAYDLETTKHNSTAHMYGEAETENGPRNIFAGFYDSGAESELRVYLSEPEAFSLESAKKALSEIEASQVSVAAIAPNKKQAYPSGADLLSGVKRDLDQASKAPQKQVRKTNSTQPARGADLLAGIKRDVEAPQKKRAVEQAVKAAAAEKRAQAPRDVAAKNALKSDGYPVPLVMKKGSSTVVYNWITEENGLQVAKANDPLSPRILTRNLAYKTGQDDKALIEKTLKEAGLKNVSITQREILEVSRELVGVQSVIATGTARRAGKASRVFAMFSHDPKQANAKLVVYEAGEKQWKDWSGVAVPMTLAGIYMREDFNDEALSYLKTIKPAEELKIYEEHFTNKMISLFQGIMTTQVATLNSMRSFNMSAATCAGMENCSVTADGVGGYEAVVD